MLICYTAGWLVVNQTREVLEGKKLSKRLYAIHEPKVAVIKKGKTAQRKTKRVA